MVGPSLTTDQRREASRRLKLGFVALVGVSAAFVSLAADATPVQALVDVAAGLLVGWGLLRYLSSVGREWRRSKRR